MSEDLFAAFNEAPQPQHQSPALTGTVASIPGNANASLATGDTPQSDFDADFDDDFGDFEDASGIASMVEPARREAVVVKTSHNLPKVSSKASSKVPSRPPSKEPAKLPFEPKTKDESGPIGKHPFAGHMDFLFDADGEDYNAGADEMNDLSNNPEAAMAYSKQLFAAQVAEQEKESVGLQTLSKERVPEHKPPLVSAPLPKAQAKRPLDSNVLFDAEEDFPDGEDSFGDFEQSEGIAVRSDGPTVDTRITTRPTLPDIDLLGIDDNPPPAHPSSKGSTRPNREQPNVNARKQPQSPQRKRQEQPAVLQDDDGWDDFETAVAPKSSMVVNNTASAPANSAISASAANIPASNASDSVPPINIPPPGTLLSIYPAIFASAQDSLFKPLASLDTKQRQILIAHPATQKFLRGHLRAAIVLGHIIAGRKLRWKRDQYLAQGMRIGPAAAGGKGGMKLTGIDKSELAKEDREVLDAVRLWKAQVGKLRGAVTTTGSTSGPVRTARLPTVPDIAEQMPVKALKTAEGGFTAPHACALCGLKREERVAKVDVHVEDSFGEWWLQGVSMHLVCKDFWDEHRGLLKSR